MESNITVETFISDVPERLAYAAHSGTSWVPEKRAVTTREEYAQDLVSIYESIKDKHVKTNADEDILEAYFPRFRDGYKKRYLAYLNSRSRIVSWGICGPSNFPVRRMEKRNMVANKRLNEFLDFRKRGQGAIVKALHPEWRPIMTGDADAIDRLREKLEEAEALQARMKAANAALRKYKKDGIERQVMAIMEVGLPASVAWELLNPDFMGNVGFARFQLTNNGARIRDMTARIEFLKRNQAKPVTEAKGDGVRIEDDPPANRIRLFFDSKPAYDIRSKLKANGFRWAPSNGAWQAYRNDRSMTLARSMIA